MRKSERKNGDKMLKIAYSCEECGTEIFEGDEYFRVLGLKYCIECANYRFGRTAEIFDIEAYLADLLHDEIGLGGGN